MSVGFTAVVDGWSVNIADGESIGDGLRVSLKPPEEFAALSPRSAVVLADVLRAAANYAMPAQFDGPIETFQREPRVYPRY